MEFPHLFIQITGNWSVQVLSKKIVGILRSNNGDVHENVAEK